MQDPLSPYRGYDTLVSKLEALRSSAVDVKIAGETTRGTPLHVVALGDDASREVSVVVAGIHAMEWIGIEVGLALLERLTHEAPSRRILFFPLLNPDGFRAVERDRRDGRNRFRRANANRVDLNRNWPTSWRRRYWPAVLFPVLGGSGRGPASEPEVRVVCDALDAALRSGATVDRFLSLHSFGRMILHPYGASMRRSLHHDALVSAARRLKASFVEPYRIRQVARWVPGFSYAHGMEIDHVHDRYGATTLLVECSSGGLSMNPRTWFDPFRWFNPPDPERVVRDLVPGLCQFVAP